MLPKKLITEVTSLCSLTDVPTYSKAQGTWGSWDHFKGEWVSFDGSLGGFPPTNTYGTMACVQGHLEILGPMKENNFGSQKLRLENKMFSGAPC